MKLIRMTKEEAVELLTNKKVYVDGQSEAIQKKLLNLGFIWVDGTDKFYNTHYPFLFIYNKSFSHCNDMIFFKNHKNTEISAEDILSIKIKEEYQFKPFDKVLVRDSKEGTWFPKLFASYNTTSKNFRFRTIDNIICRQCIPYEGNEHLAFTNKDE